MRHTDAEEMLILWCVSCDYICESICGQLCVNGNFKCVLLTFFHVFSLRFFSSFFCFFIPSFSICMRIDCWHRLVLRCSLCFLWLNLPLVSLWYFNTQMVFFRFKAGFVDTLYSWSAFNTEEIGNVIAESLKHLIKSYPIEKIHLIGELKTNSCKQCNCFRFSMAHEQKTVYFRDFKQLPDFRFYFLIFYFRPFPGRSQ